MHWATKVPNDWPEDVAAGRVTAICATTDRGEFSIIQLEDDLGYALYLNGVRLNLYTYDDRLVGMQDAEDYDRQMSGAS